MTRLAAVFGGRGFVFKRGVFTTVKLTVLYILYNPGTSVFYNYR